MNPIPATLAEFLNAAASAPGYAQVRLVARWTPTPGATTTGGMPPGCLVQCVVHPFGKDGHTVDFVVEGDTVLWPGVPAEPPAGGPDA